MTNIQAEWRQRDSGRTLVFVIGGYETETLRDAMKIKRVAGLPGDPDRPLTELYQDMGPRVMRNATGKRRRKRGSTKPPIDREAQLQNKMARLLQKGAGTT